MNEVANPVPVRPMRCSPIAWWGSAAFMAMIARVGKSSIACAMRLSGLSHVACRKAAVPHDVLDWLTPQLRLHLVDACAADVPGVQRLEVLGPTPGHIFCGQASSEDADATPGPSLEVRRLPIVA